MNTLRHVALGFLLAHVLWSLIFFSWWSYLLRGTAKEQRRKKLDADFRMVRDTVRLHQHQWN